MAGERRFCLHNSRAFLLWWASRAALSADNVDFHIVVLLIKRSQPEDCGFPASCLSLFDVQNTSPTLTEMFNPELQDLMENC